MRTLVIVPAYNEEESLEATVRSLIDAGLDYVIVNDGSTDGTLALCRRYGFNVLDLSSNLGIGGAVQAGHKYARAHGYDADVQFDGDGQHDVAYIPALIEALGGGADLVIGSRFCAPGSSEFRSTFMRRVGIRWLSWLIRAVAKEKVTDPTSGFRACGPRAIDLYCRSYPTDYPEPESIVAASRCGLVIEERPVSMNERQGGVSSINPVRSVYYMVKVTIAMLITGLVTR